MSVERKVEMSSLFSGLEKFGLVNFKGVSLFEKEEKQDTEKEEPEVVIQTARESDMIFEKTYRCPVCDRNFKSKCVMAGKTKLVSVDTDLRPKYLLTDCTKYDVIMCNNCGYSALTRFFVNVTATQAKQIKENISANFRAMDYPDNTYSYDEAILRYQLALANAVVKKGRISERAYTCLKIAWLYRGKAENLDMEDVDYDEKLQECKNEEKEFICNAYDGFLAAMEKELFPICGMDESTYMYLVADLARRCKDYENAAKLISQILTSRVASQKVKDRTRDLKELIKEELGNK